MSLEQVRAKEAARVAAAYARRPVEDPRYAPDNPAHSGAMHRVKEHLREALTRYGFEDLSRAHFLEVGCGHGGWLKRALHWGVRPERMCAVELRPAAAEVARRRLPAEVCIHVADAAELPVPSRSVDIVLQATVFSSIRDHRIRRRVAAEMRRVLRPGGVILWYDLRVPNPWNRDVFALRAGEIHQLFEGCAVELRAATLAPPLARLLAGRAPGLCALLERVPVLRSHYLGVVQPQPVRCAQ